MSKFLSKNLKSNSETSAFKKESVSKKKLSKKRGVSLIAVIIAIIVIIILAMIAYMNFNTSVDHANFARVSQDIASVEKQASIKRAENKIEYRMSLEKEQNRGFKKVYINNAPPEFVSFDAPGDLSGYLIDVDYVGENQLDIGRQKIPAITVTFGLDDAIIYDKTGKAFYLKGYYNDDQTLYHRVDVTANYPILEAPTITDVSYVLADDNKSATITVKAEPAYGGDLIVRLIEDNASAERISSNTYRMKVTKNGQYYVLVREKDKYYSSYPIEISGITQDVDTTPPVIDEMTYNQENYRSYIHVIAHDDESIITGYALTMSDETPTEWESYSLRSLSMDFDVYRTGTYYFWAKNENGLVSHELCGTEIVGQYTIRFNANGGSGGPVSQIKKENETLVLSSEMPTKSNSSFIGWAERADATSADYLPGGNYTKNGDRTLYAVWGGNIYRIIYNSNGGDEFDVVQEKEYGEDLIITTSVPTRSGFVFLGWSENITSTSPEYMSGGRYTKNANTTLYAVWSENTYTISYDANGGEGAPNSQTKRSSQDLVLSNTKPTRNGYDFLGWSENRLATAADYPAGGTYSENHDATLYAIWKLKSYTITYNANGGSGAPEDGEKLFGEDYVISSVIPTRDGHTFKGWNTSSTATNVLYTGGQSYTINDNLVLFAIWEKLKYTVSYDANGGSGAPASQTKYWGDALALSSTVPTYLGYTFLGWAPSSDATSATYEAGGQYTNNAGVVLYAVWERAEATFAIGTDFNRKIKTLSAGTNKAYTDVDTLIKSVVWSDIAPTSSNMSEANIVSAEDSKVPIYAWYENNQIKLYTDALDIYANENASCMFSNLRAANSVDVSKIDFGRTKNMSGMFAYFASEASSLNLDLRSMDTSNTTNMGDMFNGAGPRGSEFNLDLSTWDTSKVTNMNSMFCATGKNSTAYKLNISSWDTSSVTSMRMMFVAAGAPSAEFKLDLSNWDVSRVKDTNQMFGYAGQNATRCEINVSNWNFKNGCDMFIMFVSAGTNTPICIINASNWHMIGNSTVNMEYMFSGVGKNSTTVDINVSKWNLQNSIDMAYMFQGAATNASSFKANATDWNVPNITNMSYMFYEAATNATTWKVDGISTWNTSKVTNMSGMFHKAGYNAIDFTMDLSSWNTPMVKSASGMFYYAGYNAKTFNLNLSNFKAINNTDLSAMFEYAGYNATSFNLNLSNWNTVGAISMPVMFNYTGYNANVLDLDLSDWDVSTVTSIDYMFENAGYNAKSVSINMANWNLSNVTRLNSIFKYTGYKANNFSINVSNWNTSNITMMYETFYGMGANAQLFNLDLRGWDTSKVRVMDNMFSYAKKINRIYVSDTFVTTSVTNSNEMFKDCLSIDGGSGTIYDSQHIDKEYARYDGRSELKGYFYDISIAQYLPGSEFNKAIKKMASGTNSTVSTTTSNTNVTEFRYVNEMPSNDILENAINVSVTPELPIYAWLDGGTVKLYSSSERIKLNRDCSKMFSFFRGLSQLNLIEDFGITESTSNVITMEKMMEDCSNLSEIDFSGVNTSNVTTMASMCDMCSSLSNINLSSFDTSNVTNMRSMFALCGSLSNVDVSHFNMKKVENVGSMFLGSGITSLDLSSWDTSNIKIFADNYFDQTRPYQGAGMFESCYKLTTLNLVGWDTSSATIMANMFYDCRNLERIYASESFVTTNVVHDEEMFYRCLSIKGGRGTVFNSSHIRKEYAHLDGGVANPGYFWNSGQMNNGKTITYNSNTPSTFPGGETTNVVVYQANESTEETTRYSHTANIDDNGVQNGNYANNLRTKEVITIPGASSVHVSLTYGTERSYDYVYLFEGEFTGNVTNSLTGYIAKLDGGYTSPATVEYDVVGDTVTLAFYSDTSGVYYGYYATVSGTVDTFEYATLSGTYMTPNSPTNKIFIGWCESQNGNDNIYATEDEVLSNVENEGTVYAIYINSYVVTFNANGGNLGLVPATMSKIEGEDLILPSDTPTRDGYAFLGWATISTATVGQYAAGETYSIDADVELFAVWQYLNKTITFNSGSETTFPGGGTINTITYLGTKTIGTVSKVSHTTNINDDGVQNGNYADNLRTKDVITIPGASSVHVSITYGTESSYDLVYLFEGEYTGDVSRYLTGYVARLNGKSNSPATVEYDVQGDTVTLAFYSDSSGAYYGYYATISGLSDTIVYTPLSGTYKEPNDITEKVFLGWCESQNGDGEIYATEDEVLLNVEDGKTLYAIFRIKSGTYLPGSDFSSKVKKIANQSNTGNDLLIKSFNWSNTMPTQAIINDTTGKYIVSTDDSDYPIYAWFDSTTGAINLWSESAEICLNADSSYMFTGLYGLIELNLYEDLNCTNTSNLRDMNHMFYSNAWISGYDTHLTSVDLRNIDTSNVEDMSSLFNCCEELLSVNFDGLDTSSVKDLSLMFNYCLKIPSIDMSSFDTSNVETFSGMFSWCQGLKSIDVTNFDTSSATNMKDMFEYCSALKALDVTHFDTSNVTNMYEMFALCENLLSLDVTNFDTSNVTDMQGMFRYCYKLTTIDVTRFDTSNVTTMAAMFSNCRSLTSLDVTHFDTTNVTSMGSMFSDCKVLPSIDVTHFDTTNVTNMASMFSECRALTAIDVTHFNTSNVTNMSGMFSYAVALNSLDVTGFDTRKVTNMSRMFESTGFQSIDVSTFITSEVTNMARMFGSCSYLTHLDVSNFDTSKVKSFGKMFEDSIALIDINVTGFNFSGVNHSTYSVSCYAYSYNEPNDHYYDIDATEMFSGCKALTHLDLSSWRNVSNVQSMLGMFEGCRALKTLNITSFDTSNLKKTPAMFRDCTNLERIYVSSDFVTTNITNSYQMFKNCNKIKGGAGTTYNESNIEMAYAHIDGGTSNPGYFTSP